MLKLLACLFMLLDHIGFYFEFAMPEPLYIVLRCIGRLAFPIFAWSVARGCARTHNIFHYFLRMCLFAVPTEILFRLLNAQPALAKYQYPTNVLNTFALALVLVNGYQMVTRSSRDLIASLRPISPTHNTAPTAPRFDVRINPGGIELDSRLGLLLGLVMMLLSILATAWLQPDYTFYGIISVLLFFVIQERVPEKDWEKRAFQGFLLLNLVFLAISVITFKSGHSFVSLPQLLLVIASASIQTLSVAALPLCFWLRHEKKPGPAAKYAIYLFYPLHVLILCLIRIIIAQG
jgi:hypothetical protein